VSKRKHPISTHQPDNSLRLKRITPLTSAQKDVFQAYTEGKHLFLFGSAGTGKTFAALALALKDVLLGATGYKKVIIVRSNVPSRNVGFLPGKLEDKLAVYNLPYQAMCAELFGRGDAWDLLTRKGLLEVVSTSFLRGLTFTGCVVIVDESENCSMHELDTIITRVGKDCRLVFCGDLEQTDLIKTANDQTGFREFMEILRLMPEFALVEFGIDDIVRSGLVKSYLLAKKWAVHGEQSNV
jgi:phosphate starvation-inducible protein PhoH